ADRAPTPVRLKNFLANAVKGAKGKGAKRSLTPGAFEQGMLFSELHLRLGMRFGWVGFWVCQQHQPSFCTEDDFCQGKLEDSCEGKVCGAKFTPKRTRRVRCRGRLLIKSGQDGHYTLEVFWKCEACESINAGCENIFGENVSRDPILLAADRELVR